MKKRETYKAYGALYRELDGLPFEFTGNKTDDDAPDMYEIRFPAVFNTTFYAYPDEVFEPEDETTERTS